jgi:hypothetical protein
MAVRQCEATFNAIVENVLLTCTIRTHLKEFISSIYTYNNLTFKSWINILIFFFLYWVLYQIPIRWMLEFAKKKLYLYSYHESKPCVSYWECHTHMRQSSMYGRIIYKVDLQFFEWHNEDLCVCVLKSI